MKGYLFAAIWDDGTAEITITHNGEAEYRAMLSRTLTGPRKIMHGDVPKKRNGQYMLTAEVRNYVCAAWDLNSDDFRMTYIKGGFSYLKGDPLPIPDHTGKQEAPCA